MLDKTIPYFSIIMKGESRQCDKGRVPAGYRLRAYLPGDECAWARMEHAVGDFDSEENALEYFRKNFLGEPGMLERRMTVALSPEDEVVGACMAWREERDTQPVSFLHWLVVDPAHQGKGLGRMLAEKTLDVFTALGETTVYLHTQPWSWKAILLYDSLGFRMQKSDTYFRSDNQYHQAMDALERVLPREALRRLEEHSEE